MRLNNYPLIAAMLIAAGLTARDAADAADTSVTATPTLPIETTDAKIVAVTVYADRAGSLAWRRFRCQRERRPLK